MVPGPGVQEAEGVLCVIAGEEVSGGRGIVSVNIVQEEFLIQAGLT